MKTLYTTAILSAILLFAGCSKDFFKSYDKRIVGTWHISDVDRFGIGGSSSDLPFRDGTFVFSDNGNLTYTNTANVAYQGSWDIVSKYINDSTVVHTLQLTAVDYISRKALTQYYDEMNFTSTNVFKAKIVSVFHVFTTKFRR